MREATLLRSRPMPSAGTRKPTCPDDGVAWRGEQLAYLNGQRHRLITSPEVGEWLATCEAAGAGSFPESSIEETNLRGWRRTYDRATKLPVALVEELPGPPHSHRVSGPRRGRSRTLRCSSRISKSWSG